MKETRIVLASVLKPINDTRMYHKLGLSLSKLSQTEVHIVGFSASLPPSFLENVYFHPLFSFSRLSINRILAPIKFLRLLFKVKPQFIIICTHELLLAGALYKVLRKCFLIYDVQENYYLNIKTQGVFSGSVKNIIAGLVRLHEKLATPFITKFFLAEKSYAKELSFLKNNFLLVENKFKPTLKSNYQSFELTDEVKVTSSEIKLLYTGTISKLYGIFEAINFTVILNKINPSVSLTIIGFCPQPEVYKEVQAVIQNKPFISLIGGNHLVPHVQIEAAIKTSTIGLLPYHNHPSISNCIPTKMYEYIANRLPMVIQQNSYWEPIVKEFEAGLMIDFNNNNPEDTLGRLTSQSFYPNKNIKGALWKTEEEKLLNLFTTIIQP